MPPVVFPFGEGPTDKVVFEFLQGRFYPEREFQPFNAVRGKDNFRQKISEAVESEVIPGRDVRILIFRDLDAGESSASVAQSFRDLIWNLLSLWNLRPNIQPSPGHSNIYICEQPGTQTTPGLRLVLHLADNSALSLPVPSSNHTTDGYILAAGLKNAVLDKFATQVDSDIHSLRKLITDSIPDTITQAHIAFDDYKDYLAAYLCSTRFWVIHRTEEQARLVRVILERAWKYDANSVRRVFCTWLAAIEEAIR